MLQRAQVGAENMAAWPALKGTHGSLESESAGACVAVLNSVCTSSRPLSDFSLDRPPFHVPPSYVARSPPFV